MRWHELFSDLDAQAAAEESADLIAEVADRTRFEAGQVRLIDRLRPELGAPAVLLVNGGRLVTGTVSAVGADWVVLRQPCRDVLIPGDALASVRIEAGSPAEVVAEPSVQRLGLSYALRRLARGRALVHVDLVDGTGLAGTISRVGADHLDLVEHPPDTRRSPAHRTRLIATSALAAVSTQTDEWETS